MKKLLLPILFLSVSFYCSAQEAKKEMTEAEKAEWEKTHKTSFTYKNKEVHSGNLKTNNTQEENNEETTVKYYYGKKDSLFKEFKYKNPK